MEDYKNWENTGWEKMQALLDRDMPVQNPPNKRRRFPIWWLVLIPVVALSGLGYKWLSSDHQHSSVKTETNRETAASVEKRGNNTTSDNVDNKHKADQSELTYLVQSRATERKINIEKSADMNIVAASSKPNGGISPVKVESADLSADDVNDGSAQHDRIPILSEVASASGTFRSVFDLFTLNRNQDIPAFISLETADPVPTNPIKPFKNKPLSLMLTAGISSQGINGPVSYKAGIGADIRLNEKWGLKTSVQYAVLNNRQLFSRSSGTSSDIRTVGAYTGGADASADTVLMAGNVTYDEIEGVFGVFDLQANNSPAVSTEFLPDDFSTFGLVSVQNPSGEVIAYIQNGRVIPVNVIRSVQVIELPVNVYFKASPRWQFEAGMMASYIHRVNIGSVFSTLEQNDFQGVPITNTEIKGTSPASAGIRRFDLSLSVGTAYQLTPKISLYGSFRHGLIDYTVLESDNKDLFRNLDMGVRYQF